MAQDTGGLAHTLRLPGAGDLEFAIEGDAGRVPLLSFADRLRVRSEFPDAVQVNDGPGVWVAEGAGEDGGEQDAWEHSFERSTVGAVGGLSCRDGLNVGCVRRG